MVTSGSQQVTPMLLAWSIGDQAALEALMPLMRRTLVDFARSRNYQKRGGSVERVSPNEAMAIAPERGADMLTLDEALTRLQAISPRHSRVVELRYFGGLSEEETAETLKISARAPGNPAASPDGRWLLYRQTDRQIDNDIMLVENFR